jgi:hypothetical protein
MSLRARNAICGTIIILIAGYLAFHAFRNNALVSMDMRRDLTLVEHHVVESAKATGAMENKDVWSRALVFQDGSFEIRGARDGETYMQMTRRWIQLLQLPYWPAIILATIGITLCIPISAKTK